MLHAVIQQEPEPRTDFARQDPQMRERFVCHADMCLPTSQGELKVGEKRELLTISIELPSASDQRPQT